MLNAFETLGLPVAYEVDRGALEDLYFAACKENHPDRVDPSERLSAVQKTASINDAYKLLRSPEARAEHILLLHGGSLDGVVVSPQFLVETMELREALAVAIKANDEAYVERVFEEATQDKKAVLEQIKQTFAEFFAAGDASALDSVAKGLVRLRYVNRCLETCEESELI